MKSISICISKVSLLWKNDAWGSEGHMHFLLDVPISLAIRYSYRYWIIKLHEERNCSCMQMLSLWFTVSSRHTTSPWSSGRQQPNTQVRLVNTDSSGVSLRSWVNEETKHSKQCSCQLLPLSPRMLQGEVVTAGLEDISGTDHTGVAGEFSPGLSPSKQKSLSGTARKSGSVVRQTHRAPSTFAQVRSICNSTKVICRLCCIP